MPGFVVLMRAAIDFLTVPAGGDVMGVTFGAFLGEIDFDFSSSVFGSPVLSTSSADG